jgi:hypothetical protein
LNWHRRRSDEPKVASAAVQDVRLREMGASPNGHSVTDEGSTARTLERHPVQQAVVGQCARCQAESGRIPRHVEHETMSAAHRDAVGVDLDQPRRRMTERSKDWPYVAQASYPSE